MGQYCFARWCLSSPVVVCNADVGRAGGWARGRSGGRHCTAGQYGYVPLGRHLVIGNSGTLEGGRGMKGDGEREAPLMLKSWGR